MPRAAEDIWTTLLRLVGDIEKLQQGGGMGLAPRSVGYIVDLWYGTTPCTHTVGRGCMAVTKIRLQSVPPWCPLMRSTVSRAGGTNPLGRSHAGRPDDDGRRAEPRFERGHVSFPLETTVQGAHAKARGGGGQDDAVQCSHEGEEADDHTLT